MTRVTCDTPASLHGYVTGPNDGRENRFGDGAGMLHDWIFDAATGQDRAILQDLRDSIGAVVMGGTSFDRNEGDGGWGDGGLFATLDSARRERRWRSSRFAATSRGEGVGESCRVQ